MDHFIFQIEDFTCLPPSVGTGVGRQGLKIHKFTFHSS
jgi:hypothetical protein